MPRTTTSAWTASPERLTSTVSRSGGRARTASREGQRSFAPFVTFTLSAFHKVKTLTGASE